VFLYVGNAFSSLPHVQIEFDPLRRFPLVSNMKLGAIDLNLLVVFDAVMQTRSVTLAGKRLGLSQPAMSHALARLRHMLKDDLFIRSPNGMVPTPRAEELGLPVRQALDALQQSLEPTRFDPSKATRNFQIAVDNYAAVVLVSPLAAHIMKIAPGVTMEFRPSGTLHLPDLLDRSEIDLAIGPFAEQGERFSRQPLLQDDFVVILRENHPAAGAGELSIQKFAALPHLDFSSVGYATDFVDRALKQRKLRRRIGLRVPFLSGEGMLLTSDMISIVRRRLAVEMVRNSPLVIRPLPHPSPIVETAMIWSRRLDHQPAHRWLREIVSLAVKGIRSE
jgi:DNA-binding transcriptional LysR family regulator